MGLLNIVSDNDVLNARNKVFKDVCMPVLFQKGFQKAPFSSSSFGRHSPQSYSYEFCRINNGHLETLEVQIIKGDKWIKTFLNIFEIVPKTNTIDVLSDKDGIKFKLPPQNLHEMRLVTDGYKGIPLFNYRAMFKNHKIKGFYTKKGFYQRVNQLGELVFHDYMAIEYFIAQWHNMYVPLKTNYTGDIIGFKEMTLNEKLALTGLMKAYQKALKSDKNSAKQILNWLEIDKETVSKIIK